MSNPVNNEAQLEKFLRELPEQPGVYQYFSQSNELLYVGKAKNLKKRVSSYFQKTHTENRLRRLVTQIKSISYTLVESEFDALLLENNLIKSFQPKYNINLKDDKSYPYLCLTKEAFPRLYPTRRPDFKTHTYFGPYASVGLMNNMLELIKELFPLRTCNLDLSREKIEMGKYKVCLEYHIFNCKGPCENLQTEQEYDLYIQQIKALLKGNLSPAKKYFEEQMNHFAGKMEFEKAQLAKKKLERLDEYQHRSLIIRQSNETLCLISHTDDETHHYLNTMTVENGYITSSENFFFRKKSYQTEADAFSRVLAQQLEKRTGKFDQIITNIELSEEFESLEIISPKIGDKRKLLQLSIKNSLTFKQDKQLRETKSESPKLRYLIELKNDLKLKSLPNHIECFDNSNIQGTNPVASMVCFKEGRPSKKDYRKYEIKTVVGPDDFGSMKEIIIRRYTRLTNEEQALPDLIIVDGGKGQLNAAVEAMREIGVYGKIPIIGIAKRLEEIYFPGDPFPLHLDKKGLSLKLIQQLRNEAHRFAITFHRQKRSKTSLSSTLTEIKGIGPRTLTLLRKEFGSMKKAMDAPELELEKLIGKKRTLLLLEHKKSLQTEA